MEEIIVTAQRRSENLQRVPVSVTALTEAALARSNITNTAGLQQLTPGLTWAAVNRTASPFIRGVGSPDITIGSENPVAMYIDGVYIESSTAAMTVLNNVQRVEVLKGPQGTLFGRNATGGLVHIITKRPSQTTAGNFEVGYGNYDTIGANAYVTGPLTTNVSADIAMVFNDQADGWGRNVTRNREINKDRTFGARSKLLFDFDDTDIALSGDYTYQKTDIGSERNILPGRTGRPNPVTRVPTQPVPGFYDSQSNVDPTGTLKTGGVSLMIEQSLDFAKLTSISAYRRTDTSLSLDADETPFSVQEFAQRVSTRSFTQELQLSSQGEGRLRWIFGAFYMHRDARQPYFKGVGSSLAFPPFFGVLNLKNGVKSNVIAPFGQATLRVGSGTDLTAGIRYTIEHQEFAGEASGASGVVFLRPDLEVTYKKPTWRLAINQNFDNLMVYGSYNRGFKSGVYNVGSIGDPPAGPETIDAYEVGFKSELIDHRLRLNGAVFHYSYKDIQLIVPNAPSTRTINAARAKIRGAEASIEAVPINRLTLSIGLSYIATAEYTDFKNAPTYPGIPSGGNALLSFDNSGGRMIRAPKFTATLGASYTFRVGDGDLDIGGNFYHSSSYFHTADRLVRQSPYDVVNGQIAYKFDSGLRASIWGRNLLDKKYQSGASANSASVYAPAAPRTYGVKLGYAF